MKRLKIFLIISSIWGLVFLFSNIKAEALSVGSFMDSPKLNPGYFSGNAVEGITLEEAERYLEALYAGDDRVIEEFIDYPEKFLGKVEHDSLLERLLQEWELYRLIEISA